MTRRDRWIAAALAAVAYLCVSAGVARYGLTWDEPTYFRFARLQREWLASIPGALFSAEQRAGLFSPLTIGRVWLQHPDQNGHPPLHEVWQGLAGWPFQLLGCSDVLSFRLASALWLAMGVFALYRLLRFQVSALAAVVGVLAWVGVPAVWAHGHIAATETMQSFFWILLASLWPAACDRRRHGGRWFFLAAALAFAGKFTNLVAVVWVLATALAVGAWRGGRNWVLASLALFVAPCLLLLFDPFFWPWQGGLERFLDYLRQTTTRGEWIPINVFYLGESWGFRPPWHYRTVETAVALPISIALLVGLGVPLCVRTALRALRGQPLASLPSDSEEARRRWSLWPGALAASAIVVTLVVGALPQAPNHDGTRQFVFVFVATAIAAALAADFVLLRLRKRWLARGLVLGLAGAGVVVALRAEPHGLSYHSEWIGGVSGAWHHGFEVTYWGEAVGPSLLTRLANMRPEDGDTLRVYTIPKLTYFKDAGVDWLDLVSEETKHRAPPVVDAIPARYQPWCSPELDQALGPVLRLSFEQPPDALLVFFRRSTVNDSYRDLLEELRSRGDLELVGETNVDGVALARLYRFVSLRRAEFPWDPEHRLWYQPRSVHEYAPRSMVRPDSAATP